MEFEVSIFDSTNCEREYPEYLQQEEEQEQEEEDVDEAAHTVEETSDDFEFKEKPSPNIESSDETSSHSEAATRKRYGKRKANIKKSGKAFPNVEEAAYKDMHLSHSHFICTIRRYCLSQHCLCIPKQFARENGLNVRKCMIIVRDEQRSWTFGLYTSGKNTFIGSGWGEFCITHCLKEGDRLMFEIVSNGETPIFIFHDLSLKTSDMTALISQVDDSISADANPHFISTIKPYTLRFPVLYLPMAFAKSNGLVNRRELILVDEKRRPWSMQLGRISNNHFGIKRGWPQFREANGVQVGDTYKFELTNNGTTPTVYFHCKYTGN